MYRITLLFVLALGLTGRVLAAAPVAIVENISPSTQGLQAFDFVANGTVVDLGRDGILELSYLESCVHERIVGGTATIGEKQSEVQGGAVERDTIACGGSQLALAADEAIQSAATAFRGLPFGKPEVRVEVGHRSPLILLPRPGDVILQRLDDGSDRRELKTSLAANGRPYVDLAREAIALEPGVAYEVIVAGRANAFRVVAGEATAEPVPMVSRLVPF